jgi:hypothetical protein
VAATTCTKATRQKKRKSTSQTCYPRSFSFSSHTLFFQILFPINQKIKQTYLRCERQTLHRLPHTKALVFAFKTYMYPISEIKEEGLGEELALAIDGLREGSVPGMHFYKKGVVWGEAVKGFLRS